MVKKVVLENLIKQDDNELIFDNLQNPRDRKSVV